MTPIKQIKVGLTGGIGSGKTTVCRLFSMLDIPIYDSDLKGRELMSSDKILIDAIKALFGEEAYAGNQPNRGFIASEVFGYKDALSSLNAIVHPAIMRDFDKWSNAQCGEAPYVIMESAIIFDAGLADNFDYTITVSAPEEVRIHRAMERDNTSAEKITARIANQMSDAKREQKANFTITNDDRSLVWKQVLEIDGKLRKLSDNSNESR